MEHLTLDNPPQSPPSPTIFPLFLNLALELRLQVYEEYFTDRSIVIAPKSHPRTQHGTALLLASHQLHDEALPIFYRCTTLTLDMDPEFHFNGKDFAHFLANKISPGSNFSGDVTQLSKFPNIHMTLSRPPVHSLTHEPRFDGGDAAAETGTTWWQHIVPLLWTTSYAIRTKELNLTADINLGDIGSASSLAKHFSMPFFQETGWMDLLHRARARTPLSEKEFKERGISIGRNFRRSSPEMRECRAITYAMLFMGILSAQLDRQLRLEIGEHRRERVELTSDKVPDLLESARKLVGEREEKDVWLVVGSEKKTATMGKATTTENDADDGEAGN